MDANKSPNMDEISRRVMSIIKYPDECTKEQLETYFIVSTLVNIQVATFRDFIQMAFDGKVSMQNPRVREALDLMKVAIDAIRTTSMNLKLTTVEEQIGMVRDSADMILLAFENINKQST